MIAVRLKCLGGPREGNDLLGVARVAWRRFSSTAIAQAAAPAAEPRRGRQSAAAADPHPVEHGAAGRAGSGAAHFARPDRGRDLALRVTSLELWYPVRLAFAADGTELLASATAMLDLLAHSLKEYEHTAVVVAVYTDAIGSNDYNQQQSQARAAAVVAYLESKGVAEARLVARGAGESAPLEAQNTPEGRDLNRRLQVVITPLS